MGRWIDAACCSVQRLTRIRADRTSTNGDNNSAAAAGLPSPYTSAASTRRKNSVRGLKRRSSSSLSTLSPTRSEQLCALVTRALTHKQLTPALPLERRRHRQSSRYTPLNALFVDVQDATCAQLQYKLLGTKRYWYRYVKQETHGAKRWEVKLYHVRCRKSVLEAVAALHWGRVERLATADTHIQTIGFFETERAAIAASDAALRARDVTNPFTGVHVLKTPLPESLESILKVQVVSDAFERRSQRERLRIVYERLLSVASSELVEAADEQVVDLQDPPLELLSPPPTPIECANMRGFSGCVGAKVAQLPLWHTLQLHVSIVALTPAQWRVRSSSKAAALLGDTDRFGPSHVAIDRALNVDASVLPGSRTLAALVATNQERTSDDNTTSAMKSALPHFYHGLPDELKRMIADEQARANAALLTNAASARQHKLMKNTEATVATKYAKRVRTYALVAVKLQRYVRLRSQRRVLRELFQRQRSALTLQRLYRGHRGRTFAHMYFQVATCAALLIQSVYRSHVSRRATRALRVRMDIAARDIQRVYRGHCGRRYVRWVRRLDSSAVTVERVVRGYMARQRVKRIRAAQYKMRVVVPATVLIQRVWRGYCARCIAAEKRAVRQKLEVLHPAAVRIGRLLRGYLARRLAARFRAANSAARVIQVFWRALRYRKKWMDLMALRHRDRMASRIGALGRAYVARKFYQRELRKRHHRFVLQPAAVMIQRVFRGHVVRKQLDDVRDRTEAAITLQHMWRKRSTIKTIERKLRGFRDSLRHARAGQIQRSYRCYRARQQRLFLSMSYRARYGKAAVAIQSAWRSYCARVQLATFRLCARIERTACTLTECHEARELIGFDTVDARADLRRIVKYKAKSLRRIKELQATRIEWERRQPFVARELQNLTPEDLDRGWGEAFETEQHILHYSLELSVEDILSRRAQVREYDAEIDDLRLEIEDLERDFEECVVGETMALETYRDVEVAQARAMVRRDRTRKVRIQRTRWRIKTDRKHIVRRERAAQTQQQASVRPVSDLGVLSFERKQLLQLRLEQAIAKAATTNSQQTLLHAVQQRDAAVVQDLNDGLERMRAIVDEHASEFRHPKTDVREQTDGAAMCGDCGRMTCDCGSHAHERAVKRRNAATARGERMSVHDPTGATPRKRQDASSSVTRSRLAWRPRHQD